MLQNLKSLSCNGNECLDALFVLLCFRAIINLLPYQEGLGSGDSRYPLSRVHLLNPGVAIAKPT